MIDLNPDLDLLPTQMGIQLGLFTATYFVLNKVLYKPYLNLVKARRAKSVELKEKAVHAKTKVETLRLEQDMFLKEERKKVSAWTEEERKKVSDEERGIIEVARNQVAGQLAQARKVADEQLDIARKELSPLVGDYSSRIVAKLTGKKVSIPVSASSSSKIAEKTL